LLSDGDVALQALLLARMRSVMPCAVASRFIIFDFRDATPQMPGLRCLSAPPLMPRAALFFLLDMLHVCDAPALAPPSAGFAYAWRDACAMPPV